MDTEKMSVECKEILRMALHYRCNYVRKHHVPVAMESSLDEINGLSSASSGIR